MASQDSLEDPSASEFSHPLDSENETMGMVVEPTKRPMRILTLQGHQYSDLYRHVKRKLDQGFAGGL